MKAQQGSGLEDDGRADPPTRAQEPGTKPEEQAIGGAKIGRSAAGPLQDQELLLQEDTLSENGPGSACLGAIRIKRPAGAEPSHDNRVASDSVQGWPVAVLNPRLSHPGYYRANLGALGIC